MGTLRILHDREYNGVRAVVRRFQRTGLDPDFRVEITVRNRHLSTMTVPTEKEAVSLVDSYMDSLHATDDSGV